MENETEHKEDPRENLFEETGNEFVVESQVNGRQQYLIPASILISSLIISAAWVYSARITVQQKSDGLGNSEQASVFSELEKIVLPPEVIELPVVWGDLGSKMVSVGAIDAEKLKAIYEQRGAFSGEYKSLLLEQNNSKLRMTPENAGYILNLFWALGLAQKNPILDSGEMRDLRYGGAENFASTGGWTLAKGDSMDHYSRHLFFQLTLEQQALVDKVSRGIYRPCCGNSTHFPDCNHGMAMLGLLELMASEGASEGDMWKTALAVNSYWFPDTYLTIAAYMKQKGVDWKDVNPREILGSDYSSAQGYRNISSQVVQPASHGGGGGCGVDTGETAAVPPRRQSGCGI